MNLKLIQTLSLREKKSLLERALKLQEETGELAEQILIHRQASGTKHKKKKLDGIREEAIDVILVALSIFFLENGSIAELAQLLESKAKIWKQRQLINEGGNQVTNGAGEVKPDRSAPGSPKTHRLWGWGSGSSEEEHS